MNQTITRHEEMQAQAKARAYSISLDEIDPSDETLFEADTVGYYFERLRKESPVHYCRSPVFGGYWSVTKYKDIMEVDTHPDIYSSEAMHGGIALIEPPIEQRGRSFIAMDPPDHDASRKAVSPAVAPGNLAAIENTIRDRTINVIDGLPRNETFNWVERVSIELTTQMLAALFDFPFEDRHLLPWWSDVATSMPGSGAIPTINNWAERKAELEKCFAYFTKLWNERVNAPPKFDLISMMAHAPATRNMSSLEYWGNVTLLIVGGNDTTRNSMTGGLHALLGDPDQFAKLRANPALIASMVPEIIRWQTPLAHMRRTAVQDTELAGRQIKKGDKVVMWYISGNRDEEAIENPNQFIIDRAKPRQHMAFGFGIHRCLGNRLAEMQLKILWEEILKRIPVIEPMGEARRVRSCFARGFTELPVRIPA